MFFAHLHPFGGDRPNACIQIELLPSRGDYLVCSGGCENEQFQRTGSRAVLRANQSYELSDLAVRKSGVMRHLLNLRPLRQQIVKMALESGRVFARSVTAHGRPV